MKKFILAFLAVGIAVTGCSSSDEGPSFESSIMVDGVVFKPSEVTAYTETGSAENSVTFVLGENTSVIENQNLMVVEVFFPTTQSSASGTYPVNGIKATGNYTKGANSYLLYNGSITVDDFGNNKYKVTFQNVKGTQGNGSTQVITITGNVNGKFQESN